MASQTAVPDWATPTVVPAPDWAIAPAIHQQESGGALTAQTSPTGAMGGWQIEPTTFAQYATPGERITNPVDNKAVGERIIADLTKRTGGDPARVAVGYVSGPGNIAPADSPTPWIKNPTVGGGSSKRVSDYVAEVVKRLNPVSDAEAAQPAAPDWATPAPAAATPDWATPAVPASATQPEAPGFIGSLTGGLFRGAKESLTGVGQTVTGPFADRAQAPAQNDALAQTLAKPFSQGWSDPSWWAAKIGEGIGSSGPMVAGAVLGAGAASAIAPEAPVAAQLAGAALGGAGGNFIQQLAPAYQQAIAEGLTHDQAVDRALKETGIGSAVAGAMSAVPGGRLLGQWAEGTAKRAISEALVNIFGVQPAIGAAGQVATAAVENKPLTLDDLLTAYAQNVGMGAAFHVAGAGKRAVDRARAPEDLAPPPEAIRPEQPKPTDLAATVPPVTGETPKPGDLLHTMQERGPIVPGEPVNKLGQDVNSASINAPEAADGLYVNRPVINAQEIHDWAVRNGVPEPVAPADMHATQVYSRKAAPLEPLRDEIVAGPTLVAPIGDQGAVALHINSPEMQARFAEAKAAGATHDYPEYQPHVTLSYNAPGFDASKIAEPMPAVRLGPEIHAPLDEAKAAAVTGRAPAVPDWATPAGALGEPLPRVEAPAVPSPPAEIKAAAEMKDLPPTPQVPLTSPEPTPPRTVLPSSAVETTQAVNPGHVSDGIKQASFDIGEALEPGGRGGGGQKPPTGGAPPAGGDGGGRRRGLMQSAARMEGIVNAMPNDPLSINRMSWVAKHGALAQGLASDDRTSADYLTALLDRQAARHSLTTEGANGQRDYGRLPDKERLPIDQALEWGRMTGTDDSTTGSRTIYIDSAVFHGRPWPLQFTKPGETVHLNAEQARILNNLRTFLDQAWKQHAEAQARRFGYDGPFLTKDVDGKFQIDLPAIKAEFDNATDKGLRKSAERALGIATAAAEGGRGGSYFPLMRYGDWSIKVTPKKPVSGTGHPLPNEGWVSKVETGNAFDSLKGIVKTEHGNTPPRKVLEEAARLRQRFPAADFHMEINKPSPRLRDVVDMPMLERVLADTKLTDPATGEKLKDEVIEKLYQQMLAGFRKPSDNVPGYSTDFPRAIGDYVRQWAGSTANALHSRNVDDSYLATQLHRDPSVARYWRNHKAYNEGDESRVWSAARRLAFFKYLWGSPMSAAIQLTQTPLITGTQLSGVIGLRGQAMVHTALARVGAALRADAREGVKIDIAKIPGITAAERAGLMQADKEGRLNPSLPKDLAGGTLSDAMRKRFPAATRIYDIGSSMFNTADRMNRVAAWLAYHRAAQLPGAAERFNKAYAKDALFQQQVGRDLDPVKLANWASDETQFLSGRMGSAPVMRGAGSALFQFQHYNANYLRLLHKNFTRMGPQGKVAGTMMLLGLAGAAGLGGLPFVSDLERLANDGIQLATGIDPRLDAQLREFINDTGFAKMMDGYMGWTPGQTGEVIMEGPTRLTGLDLGRRIGLGNLLPQSTDIYQGVPFLSATLGAAMEAANRYKSGQPIGAAAALLPAGIGNPLKGYGVYPNEGVRQQRGQMVFPPSEVTPAMQVTRALGATPTPIARRQQAMADQSAIQYATDEAAKNLLARIAGEFTLAEDAQKQGDTAGAAAHTQAATDYIQANAERLANADVPDWQQIPTPRAAQIRKTIARYLFPVRGTAARNQRMKQEELSASPYLTQ